MIILNKIYPLIYCFILFFISSCVNHTDKISVTKEIHLPLIAKSGSQIEGFLDVKQKGDYVTLKIKANNVPLGEHAIHIHENPDCSAEDASSAGSHWNPEGEQHGKWDSDHYHLGDIGNVTVKEDGYLDLEFTTDQWCLTCHNTNKLIKNRSIIIHEKEDDFTTQPTGNAGGRIACSVI